MANCERQNVFFLVTRVSRAFFLLLGVLFFLVGHFW